MKLALRKAFYRLLVCPTRGHQSGQWVAGRFDDLRCYWCRKHMTREERYAEQSGR